ncbi:hypothetical protein Rsub_03579 [Raphidocelis subcapitata]|uniref:Uncharacterized protein n=1 Tax=Raphidocelis subcapitata TaxID=307507 RepID=A0A2V0NV91_9CHLO|nr:hypothetical protein Rsub_03579 [Raphidocelis subcapitata]|eukprot:GBF91259.1 hypothetical protein Rsub_03579 [Raphidocelis subcapitata]
MASPAKPAAAQEKAKTPEKAKADIQPEKQHEQPGMEWNMQTASPARRWEAGAGRLRDWDKKCLITGGDSGIGRSVAVHFAREGADVAIVYLPSEEKDVAETEALVAKEGRRCVRIAGDVGSHDFCQEAVKKVVDELGGLDVLVNNASQQHYHEDISETNVYGYFYMAQAALKHMKPGASIINTTSVVAYRGSASLLVYSATKGAEARGGFDSWGGGGGMEGMAMTRALANLAVSNGIRVNACAPGPIWTPLIPATFPEEKIKAWKGEVPMDRPGQPAEVAPCYVFLACEGGGWGGDSSFYIGQTLHPDGGVPMND